VVEALILSHTSYFGSISLHPQQIYIYMYVDLVWHMKHQVNYDNYERVILARNLMVIAILTHWAHGIVILSMPVGRYCIQITARDQGLHAGAHFGDLGALGGSSHSGTDS
jgi:hypothetical protein